MRVLIADVTHETATMSYVCPATFVYLGHHWNETAFLSTSANLRVKLACWGTLKQPLRLIINPRDAS